MKRIGIRYCFQTPIVISCYFIKLVLKSDHGGQWSVTRKIWVQPIRNPVSWYLEILGDGGPSETNQSVFQMVQFSLLVHWNEANGLLFADRSEDNGSTWSRSNDIHTKELVQIGAASLSIEHVDSKIPVSEQSFHGRGIIQPTLWESSPGTVHMLLRSTENRVYRSDSTDFGRTWSTAYPIELPNNNSGIDLTRIRGGHLLLVYNPVGKNWGARTPLAVAMSSDNGSSWEQLLLLEAGPGEYSYPAIISQNDTVIISYTADRRGITVCRFKIS